LGVWVLLFPLLILLGLALYELKGKALYATGVQR
jgi:hypothetical protein